MPIVNQLVGYIGGVGEALANGLTQIVTTAGTAIAEVGKALIQVSIGG